VHHFRAPLAVSRRDAMRGQSGISVSGFLGRAGTDATENLVGLLSFFQQAKLRFSQQSSVTQLKFASPR